MLGRATVGLDRNTSRKRALFEIVRRITDA
jgi:hypothetical protein